LINDGGEGYIYEVEGHPDLLVKVFKAVDSAGLPVVTEELHNKLKYMCDNPPEVLVSKGVVAWPKELVYERGRLTGFIMPRLDFHEHIQRTYSYRHPKLEADEYERFPSVESRIKIAINLCSAIDELHRKGYVFGDFNHHNIGVNYLTGRIFFTDNDSFHITDNSGVVYRTNVIMSGYLAPEIIKHCKNERAGGRPYDLDKVALPTFTKESDYFCLAIHIFKLLMNGVDPFRGIKYDAAGSTASPFVGNEAVERGSYVFKTGYKPSAVFCPSAGTLPPDILELFNKAFMYDSSKPVQRPSAADWYIVLNRLLASELKQCSLNGKHHYYKFLNECPYCTADNQHLTEQVSASGTVPFRRMAEKSGGDLSGESGEAFPREGSRSAKILLAISACLAAAVVLFIILHQSSISEPHSPPESGNGVKSGTDDSRIYYVYDDNGNIFQEIYLNPDGSIEFWFEYIYDANGNRIKSIRYNAEGHIEFWSDMEYDGYGNIIKTTVHNALEAPERTPEFQSPPTYLPAPSVSYPAPPYYNYGGGEELEHDSDGEIIRVTYFDVNGTITGWSEFFRAADYFEFIRVDYWVDNGALMHYTVNEINEYGEVIVTHIYNPDGDLLETLMP